MIMALPQVLAGVWPEACAAAVSELLAASRLPSQCGARVLALHGVAGLPVLLWRSHLRLHHQV